jgi:hypothetical protein
VVLQQDPSARATYPRAFHVQQARLGRARRCPLFRWSALEHAYQALSDQGLANDSAGDALWLDGHVLAEPREGALKALLERIGVELHTEQRPIVAAAFALRFGAAGSAAIRPFVITRRVPDVRLSNIALQFGEDGLPKRVLIRTRRETPAVLLPFCFARAASIADLRAALFGQADPVLRALSSWSGLKLSTLWGLVTSVWANEIAKLGSALGCPDRALDIIARLFRTSHPAFQRRSRFYLVQDHSGARICHVRGSCCLNYRVGDNSYCASCPVRARHRTNAERESFKPRGLSL